MLNQKTTNAGSVAGLATILTYFFPHYAQFLVPLSAVCTILLGYHAKDAKEEL